MQVSVFDFIQPGINTDDIGLDRALLAAIYHPDEMTVEKRKAEMRLAIAWKNVEYAKYEIFNIRNADYTKVFFILITHEVVTSAYHHNVRL